MFKNISLFFSLIIITLLTLGVMGQNNVYDCSTLSEWSISNYSEGDLVQNGDKVYQCKAWPYSEWAGSNSTYQPPTGMAWTHAWSEVGICSSIPDYTDCSDLYEWEIKSYEAGHLIVADNYIYKCKPWPYCDWCGSAPTFEPNEGDNWQMAWDKIGSCEISTIVATAESGGKIVPEGTISVNRESKKEFHIFPDPGYSIKDVIVNGLSVGPVDVYSLSAENSSGSTITATFNGSFNVPPTAIENDITVTDFDGNGVQEVELDASQSYDPDGTIVKYYWEVYTGGLYPATYTRSTPYVEDRDFPVGTMAAYLTVTDDKGAVSNRINFVITVKRKP